MKFSTKVRYGTRAMVDIARLAGQDGGVTISTVAESQDLSQKYLETLLVRLKSHGLLKSLRGKNGGYSLNRDPGEICIYHIYEALEGPLELVDCRIQGEECKRESLCDTVGLWKHLTETLSVEMKGITLEDLMLGKDMGDING